MADQEPKIKVKGKTNEARKVKNDGSVHNEGASRKNGKGRKGQQENGDDLLEVIKLKYQVANLQKTNDKLTKKLDRVSKGHQELSREHASLQGSLRQMGAAEQQLVEELLSKVKEKETLKAELERVVRERDELELMMHSLGSDMCIDDETEASYEQIMACSDIPAGSPVPGSSSVQEEDPEDVAQTIVDPCASVRSDSEHLPSCGSDIENRSPDLPDMKSAEKELTVGQHSMSQPTEDAKGAGCQKHRRGKSFKGRGSVQYYAVLEETA